MPKARPFWDVLAGASVGPGGQGDMGGGGGQPQGFAEAGTQLQEARRLSCSPARCSWLTHLPAPTCSPSTALPPASPTPALSPSLQAALTAGGSLYLGV